MIEWVESIRTQIAELNRKLSECFEALTMSEKEIEKGIEFTDLLVEPVHVEEKKWVYLPEIEHVG